MDQKLCPSCNASVEASTAFCPSCGASMNPAATQAAAYQAPAPPAYQPPAYQPPAPPPPSFQQSTFQPVGGYAPGMDPADARASQAAQMSGLQIPAGYAPAGFGVRFVAYLIDAVIMGVASYVLTAVGLSSISWLVSLGYLIYFWGSTGQTFGKKAMNLTVISTDGQPMSYGKAALRWVGYVVSGMILGIGFLMIAFDDAKRGLHDRIATTLVVKKL